MHPRVLNAIFSDSGFNCRIQGHPSQALEIAHKVAAILFINRRWRFSKIEYFPPEDTEFASKGFLQVSIREVP